MALTEQEKEIVRQLKSQGYSTTRIAGFLGGERLNKTSTIREQLLSTPEEEQPSGLKSILKDIPSDIKESFSGSVDAVSGAIQRTQDIRGRVESGETSPVAGTFQTIGAGLRAGAETIGQGILGIGKAFVSPKTEEKIAGGLEKGVKAVVESDIGQQAINQFQSLQPETQRNIQAGAEVAEGLTTMFGFTPVINQLKKQLTKQTVSLLKKSDEVLTKTKKANPIKQGNPSSILKEIDDTIADVRLNLSNIDPQLETALKNSDFSDVNRHFQQAKNAAADPSKPTPIALVGNKAEEAFDSIKQANINAIKGKKNILDNVQNKTISKEFITPIIKETIESVNEKFGIKVSSTGRITGQTGRLSQLDAVDQKLLTEYFQKLNSLGKNPSTKKVDDFIDWAQSQLYKQTKSLSKLETASDPVISQLRQATGKLNSLLKKEVGGGYGEVNSRIVKLLELQDEISRALGADGRKGAGFVKRLFSPAGEQTRKIFEEIKRETGIDLFKEAILAKFAMENVGDVRQRSLLQKIDVELKDAADLDLTKPLSIVNWLREKADLDGQELANELLKRIRQSD